MAYYNSVLSQVLRNVPRLDFEKHANAVDGRRRSDALSRWSQFVALAMGHSAVAKACVILKPRCERRGNIAIT